MAKDLRYYLRFDTNGRKVMRELGIEAKDIDAALDAVGMRANKAKNSIMGMAATTVTLQGLTQALQSLHSTFSSLTAKYDQQVAAEVRLEQSMHNTMDATAAQIQSIKDLTAAQQQIGIVGDEVQLAGAQELATYLTKKSSLEALIPVMNDMIAQQYAYNATAESATSIATMLGKVMNGQVSALSRYGYTFDEAQAKVLKFGDEAERAAVLAEVVGQSVGGMNEKLAQTPSGRMTQLSNAMGDLAENVGGMASRVMPFMTWTNQAMILRNNLIQLNTSLNLTKAAHAGLIKITTVSNATIANGSRVFTMFGASATAAATATKVAVVALRGLVALSGVGLVLVGLSYAFEKLTDWMTKSSDAAKKAVTAQKLVKEAAEASEKATRSAANSRADAAAGIEVYLAKIENFKGSKKEEKKLIEELNNSYGSQMGYFASLNKWYTALTQNGEAYCQVLEDQIEMEELRERKAELRKKKALITKEDGTLNYEMFKPGFWESSMVKLKGLFTGVDAEQQFKELKGRKIEAAEAAMAEILRQDDEINRQIKANVERAAARVMPIKGAEQPLDYNTPTASKIVDPGEIWDLKGYDEFVQKRKFLEKQVSESVDFLTKARYERELNYLKEVLKRRETQARWELNDVQVERFHSDPGSLLTPHTLDIKIEKPQIEDTSAELARLNNELRETVDIMSELQGSWGALKGGVDGFNTLSEAMDGNKSAWERLSGVMDGTFQIYNGLIQLQATFNKLQELVGPLFGKSVAAKQADTQATQQNTNANVANAASGTLASNSKIPFVGIAIGLAAVASIIAAMSSLPKFAKGGLAFGPTLGLFGEYAGASNNPEVVAPLNTLSKYLQPAGVGDFKVETKLRGHDLYVVVEHERKKLKRI